MPQEVSTGKSDVEKAQIETTAQVLNWVIGVLRLNPGPVAFDLIHEKCHRAWEQFDAHCLDARGAYVGPTKDELLAAKADTDGR